MNIFTQFYAYLQLRYAVQMAEKAHKKNPTRYYVLPNSAKKVRLIVSDRTNFRRLRQKGYISSNMQMKDAMHYCFYYTADAAGKNGMTSEWRAVKQMHYYEWFEKRLAKEKRIRRAKFRAFINRLCVWKKK